MTPAPRPRELPAVDVLVVGSGIAGLTAALDCARGSSVALVTKADLGAGSTRWAQGGIAVVSSGDDSPALHASDTVAAGAGLCDEAAVRALCENGPAAVAGLAARGVAWDLGRDGLPARGLEAAHSRHRILHAGGDVTGARISDALVAAVRASGVRLHEGTALADLLVEGGRVTGADLLTAGGERLRIRAAAVVLASGGAGQLFRHTTNPAVATGDGLAAAWRAGALLADLEFFQFHPTAAALPEAFLVSEAVRGEGAVLRDERGERYMCAVDPRAELAPRDVVARATAAVMARQDGRPALLDATGVAARLGVPFARRFPGIDALCRGQGLDPERDLVPVTPAAHYWMGGVRTDALGRTSLPGLWAVGEVACTGVHGANRLASNSLLEAVVLAGRAAADVCAGGGGALGVGDDEDVLDVADAGRARRSDLPREDLQRLMWEHAGVVRDAAGLDVAAKQLAPSPDETRAPADVAELEDANLRTAGRLLVLAAAARQESRGAHWRGDHPAPAATARRTVLRRIPC
ncbi:L-aspartate oxidase [Kineococcus xinjiangensis]|uniref:L-aspartate oxidase n=1 Tax=Kineococcus xinjiangensis TaxID=512762 RepID=A0A2S6IT26_9ACTN|nr:L-aspartate oxidase [Kineococcus xinjiangensis]PPK97330.1 L-aspartate oxidase [Kineococcus xinjiangensis]